jgi:hypothetical protein
MNSSSCCSDKTKSLFAWFIAVVGTFLLLGALTVWLRGPDASAPDAARAVERKKLLAEVRAANQEARVYKLEDVNKGWYRLSTERAMQIVAEEWRDPAAGKEKLVKRFESSQKQVSFE